MAFLDEVILNLTAGKGGDGVVRWRHEKFRPLAGPGGGNAGKGGSIYVLGVSDNNLLSTNYRVKKSFKAEDGQNGQSEGKFGKDGEDLILTFPLGTIITNLQTEESFEIINPDEKILLLKGGVGGLGNEHFKGSKNQTPVQSTKGKAGENGNFKVELRLIADVGLIGLPNAGKSTLLNLLSNANAKIGDYPFTTLEPNLGVCDSLVIADIPGLIEGASDGKGLGDQFLKHILRTKFLVHLISCENESISSAYQTIITELKNYNQELINKKMIIILTKTDLVDKEKLKNLKIELGTITSDPIYTFSAYDSNDLIEIKKSIFALARN